MRQITFSSAFITCFLAFGLLNFHTSEAQAFLTDYVRYLSEIRKGNEPVPPTGLLDEKSLLQLLPIIEENLSDSLASVRMACYQTLQLAQQRTNDEHAKKTILNTQLKGLQDAYPDICGFTIDNISKLPSSLFDDQHKAIMAGMMDKPIPNKPVLMKMAGVLNIKQSVSSLQKLALPGNPSEIRWAAFMALSRMGDKDAISYTDHRLRNLNSHMVVTLVPSVIYTRQKQLYDYLVELLYSNNKHCGPKEIDNAAPVNCAYEILEQLAPAIEEFPIDVTSFGELDVNQQALETARQWFKKNPDYRIVAVKD